MLYIIIILFDIFVCTLKRRDAAFTPLKYWLHLCISRRADLFCCLMQAEYRVAYMICPTAEFVTVRLFECRRIFVESLTQCLSKCSAVPYWKFSASADETCTAFSACFGEATLKRCISATCIIALSGFRDGRTLPVINRSGDKSNGRNFHPEALHNISINVDNLGEHPCWRIADSVKKIWYISSSWIATSEIIRCLEKREWQDSDRAIFLFAVASNLSCG